MRRYGREFARWAGWILAEQPTPLPGPGTCRASGCRLGQRSEGPFCGGHLVRWRSHLQRFQITVADDAEVARFARIAHLPDSRIIALWRLHPVFHDQFLAGLLTTAELGGFLQLSGLRGLVRAASIRQAPSLQEWTPLATRGFHSLEIATICTVTGARGSRGRPRV